MLRNGWRVEWEISILVYEAGHIAGSADRTPANISPLAIQRLMNSQVGVGMVLRPVRHFRKPRAGHEDACGGNPAFLKRFKRCAIDGMVHAEVVRVNHEKARRRGIAEPFLNGFRRSLREHGHAQAEQSQQGTNSYHVFFSHKVRSVLAAIVAHWPGSSKESF